MEKYKQYIERNYSDRFYEGWLEMSAAGLHVPDEIHRAKNKRVILVSYEKETGSELYGKLRAMNYSAATADRQAQNDRRFLEIMANERNRVLARMDEIARIAADNHIILPFDDPGELIINPDGTWDIICIDLSETVIDPRGQLVYLKNKVAMRKVIGWLDELADNIG